MNHDRVLWILQWVFGIYFVGVGVNHFIVPDNLPAMMSWMYELSDTMHAIAGIAEILGGLGLIVPAVTRIRPELTPLAAAGLVIVMVGAAIWHASRGEAAQIATNVVLGAVMAYVAYGRWRLAPLAPKAAATA